MYPMVLFDALRVKIRDEDVVRNKAVHLALGVVRDGRRDALGPWSGRDRTGEVLDEGGQRSA